MTGTDESQLLSGKRLLITGVSRPQGIGWAIAQRAGHLGASLHLTGWAAHDAEMSAGAADISPTTALVDELTAAGVTAEHRDADLADPDVPADLIAEAAAGLGGLDGLVANHARSDHLGLADTTATELDRQWAVNVRATILLVQAFTRVVDRSRPGRVVLFTSGQHRGAMQGELGYVATKGAIHQMTRTLAAEVPANVTVNAVDPGATDTGWAPPDLHDRIARNHPRGRWGTPADAARVVTWLLSDDADWINGQVIVADGGAR